MRYQCGHTTRDTAGDIVFTKSAEASPSKTRVVRKYNAFFFSEAGGFRETRTKLLTRCGLEVQIFFFFVATAAVCPYWCEKQHTAKRKLNRFSATVREERPNLKALLQSSAQCLRTVTTSRRVLDEAFVVIRIVRDCRQTALFLSPLFFFFFVCACVGVCCYLLRLVFSKQRRSLE